MRRAVIAVGLLLVAMFIFGPRAHVIPAAEISAARAVPDTPDQLEAFLERERVAGVIPGTEARIVWHAPSRDRTTYAVVYLHGFSASRQELAPLPEQVAQALEANLFEARLAGHGIEDGRALAQATAETWLRDVREAIAIGHRLGDALVVLASSTGATLMTLVAVEDQPDVFAYVFLSPNFGPRDPSARLLLLPWAERWVPLLVGAERSWVPVNEPHGRYWTTRYPMKALFPMMATVSAAANADVSGLRAPVLVLFSPDDPVVDPAATQAMLDRMTGSPLKRIIPVDGPGDTHVLAGDILSPARTSTLADTIVGFVRALERE